MVLLNLVWKSREANLGNADPPLRTQKDLLETEVTLIDAWMLLTCCPESMAKHVIMEAAAADMRVFMFSEVLMFTK